MSNQRWIVCAAAALTLAVALVSADAEACPNCATAKIVRSTVYGEDFWSNVGVTLAPIAVLASVLAVSPSLRAGTRPKRAAGDKPMIFAAGLIGVGLGGFLDGIALHQILQWHHMLSARLPTTDLVGVQINMVWDGLFHAFTWLITLVGVVLLWRAGASREHPWSWRGFAGGLSLGWGLFNLVEGVVDHHVLRLHHVRPGRGQLAWDLSFLGLGLVLALGGWAAIRGGRTAAARASASGLDDGQRPETD